MGHARLRVFLVIAFFLFYGGEVNAASEDESVEFDEGISVCLKRAYSDDEIGSENRVIKEIENSFWELDLRNRIGLCYFLLESELTEYISGGYDPANTRNQTIKVNRMISFILIEEMDERGFTRCREGCLPYLRGLESPAYEDYSESGSEANLVIFFNTVSAAREEYRRDSRK